MSKDLVGILSVRDKLKRLFSEPTLDKVFNVFTSAMLGTSIIAFLSTYSDPNNIQFIRANPSFEAFISVNIIILMSFILAVLSGITAVYYKRRNEPILKQSDERRKANKDWDYLFEHRHLKKAEITLDKTDEWKKEMAWMRNALVSLIKYQVEKNDITEKERQQIENIDDLPDLPEFPELADEIKATTTPIITKEGEMVINPPTEESIAKELAELENLEL